MPVMPATPFLLLSAYCYARSSERCHTWLTTNRLFGKYFDYAAGRRRLSLVPKMILIASCWVTAILSVLFLAPNLAVKILNLAVALVMSAPIVLHGRGKPKPEADAVTNHPRE